MCETDKKISLIKSTDVKNHYVQENILVFTAHVSVTHIGYFI